MSTSRCRPYALGKKQYPYTDLSQLIQALYDAYGPQRLMWASDSPFQVQPPHTYSGSIELVRDRLHFLSQDDREWQNLAHVRSGTDNRLQSSVVQPPTYVAVFSKGYT